MISISFQRDPVSQPSFTSTGPSPNSFSCSRRTQTTSSEAGTLGKACDHRRRVSLGPIKWSKQHEFSWTLRWKSPCYRWSPRRGGKSEPISCTPSLSPETWQLLGCRGSGIVRCMRPCCCEAGSDTTTYWYGCSRLKFLRLWWWLRRRELLGIWLVARPERGEVWQWQRIVRRKKGQTTC